MKVVAYFQLKEIRFNLPDSEVEAIRAELPGVEIVSVEDDAALPGALEDADAFVGWTFPRELFARAARLRWVQSANAGIEANLFPELVASEVVLTNGGGMHSVAIPEHTLALMLALARNVHRAIRQQMRHEWDRFGAIAHAGGIRELAGSRLAILGAGPIGIALARLAGALGMTVRILRRRAGEPVADVEEVVGRERLHETLAWADFVVLALPLTAETSGMIDRDAIGAMRSSTVLVNIARGEVIDDDALVDALRCGAIAGAALDAFREEPLPAASPYWDLENVIITPHVSGYTPTYFQKVTELFRDNLRRFARGEPLRNVVDKRLGYVVPAT